MRTKTTSAPSRSCSSCGPTSRSSARSSPWRWSPRSAASTGIKPVFVEVAEGQRSHPRRVRVRVLRGQPLDPGRAGHRGPHRRRNACCTPATSSSTSCRSTAGPPTCRACRGSATPASTCSCATRPTPRYPASGRRRARSGPTLHRLIRGADGRVIVACFASNVDRVQQIIDAAVALGPQGVVRRPVDGAQHGHRAGPRLPDRRRRRRDRHRRRGDDAAPTGSC